MYGVLICTFKETNEDVIFRVIAILVATSIVLKLLLEMVLTPLFGKRPSRDFTS